jgi:PAT family beta-lactamase induction signal transducer AmpG
MGSGNLLDSTRGRFATFGLLYISEGIPYGFSATAMVAFMRVEGISLSQIGAFTAALFIPWSFKWVWAPLIDLIKLRRFGGRKGWILICTTMMMVTLLLVAAVDFQANFDLLLIAIVLNNFFCATQDVAIDSLAVSTLREEERGRGNGFMFGGQYLGIAMGGGGAVFVFGIWGFNAALAYISGLLLLSWLFVLFFVKDPETLRPVEKPVENLLAALVANLKDFGRELYVGFVKSGRGPKLALIFALLPCGAMALQYAILGTIVVDYGLTTTQVAEISIYTTMSAGLGCLVGGAIGDRYGLIRTQGVFYIFTALPTLLLASQIASVGLANVPFGLFYAIIIGHGLLFGMAYGVHNAIFMGMTNPAVAATQFTAFMGMSNIAISYTNYWQGSVAEQFGYATVLYADAAIMLIPLAIIPFLRYREPLPAPA